MLVTYNIFNSVDLLNADYWRLFLKLWLTGTKGKLETFLVWIAWIKWEWRCSFCLYLVLLLANLCLRDCCECLCSRAENLDYYHVWSPEYKSWFFASQLQTSRPFCPHIPGFVFCDRAPERLHLDGRCALHFSSYTSVQKFSCAL